MVSEACALIGDRDSESLDAIDREAIESHARCVLHLPPAIKTVQGLYFLERKRMSMTLDIDGEEYVSLATLADCLGVSRTAASDWAVMGLLDKVLISQPCEERSRYYIPRMVVDLAVEMKGKNKKCGWATVWNAVLQYVE